MRVIMAWHGKSSLSCYDLLVSTSTTSRYVGFGLARRRPSFSSNLTTLDIKRSEESGIPELSHKCVRLELSLMRLVVSVCFLTAWTKICSEKHLPSGLKIG